MKNYIVILFLALLLSPIETLYTQELIIYSGRSKSLIEPLIKEFEHTTGIRTKVRYGNTSQLAIAIVEEGKHAPADIFWAQDVGALGVLSRMNILSELPDSIFKKIPEVFKSEKRRWVPTSGRARVIAYSPERVDVKYLPQTIFELKDSRWKNRVGWAPSNASFQIFISAMIKHIGRDKTKEWLAALHNNGARSYHSNVPIIEAIAAREIDLGITNHYYLVRLKKQNPAYPVSQTFFTAGDPGNFIISSGVGMLKTATNRQEADRFIEFLLSREIQQYFAGEIFEYPVIDGITPDPSLLPMEELLQIAPPINPDELDILDDTLRLLREVGIL